MPSRPSSSARSQLRGLIADYLIGWALRLDPDRFRDENGKLYARVIAPVFMEDED